MATSAYGNATYIGRWSAVSTPSGTAMTAISGGSLMRLRFTGTSLAVNLYNPARNYATEVEWRIDGGAWTRGTIASIMTLASGLASGSHTCEMYLAGNEDSDSRWTTHYGLQVLSFTVDTSATTSAYPTGNAYKMLTIGDSIAEGKLILGYDATGDVDRPWSSDGRRVFTSQIAQTYGIDNYQFCFGGASLLNAYAPSAFPAMPSALPYSSNGVTATDPTFDTVLIEVGNNDGSASSASFRTAYASLIDWVRQGSPNAKIVCLGTINNFATARRADIAYVASQKSCTYVDTSAWSIDAGNPPYAPHPTLTGQGQLATLLGPTIASALAPSYRLANSAYIRVDAAAPIFGPQPAPSDHLNPSGALAYRLANNAYIRLDSAAPAFGVTPAGADWQTTTLPAGVTADSSPVSYGLAPVGADTVHGAVGDGVPVAFRMVAVGADHVHGVVADALPAVFGVRPVSADLALVDAPVGPFHLDLLISDTSLTVDVDEVRLDLEVEE